MFPSLPYHNLAAAHDYLNRHLQADSPYHSLSQPSWWSVAKHAFRRNPARLLMSARVPYSSAMDKAVVTKREACQSSLTRPAGECLPADDGDCAFSNVNN
jgi:hypothetical protein